jgi:hypothetical protein
MSDGDGDGMVMDGDSDGDDDNDERLVGVVSLPVFLQGNILPATHTSSLYGTWNQKCARESISAMCNA